MVYHGLPRCARACRREETRDNPIEYPDTLRQPFADLPSEIPALMSRYCESLGAES